MDCEINKQHMVEIFGKFADNPSAFRFERGEISLIRGLVAHVKQVVDGNGENSGFHRFKYKQNKRKKGQNIRAIKHTGEVKTIDTNTTILLKEKLFEKVKACIASTGNEVEALDPNIVEVELAAGGSQIYGSVICVLCDEMGQSKKSKKRVFYQETGDNWVLSNFKKHLVKAHQLNPKSSRKKHAVETPENNKPEEESVIEIDIEPSSTPNAELVQIENDWLYKQLADQIAIMVSECYSSGDEMGRMVSQFDGNIINVTVAPVPLDGNCLFGAMAHQLYRHPINSIEHKEATKLLRAEVVDHILAAENFERFIHPLKDRVYDLHLTYEITDIVTESKIFFRHVLSRENKKKSWGGYESILAVSEKYEVNIITFNEEGTCILYPNKNSMYEKTIAIAYRVGYYDGSGKEIRNHYDSVIDIDAEDINTCTDFLIKQMNSF